jgi:hypothetical protein
MEQIPPFLVRDGEEGNYRGTGTNSGKLRYLYDYTLEYCANSKNIIIIIIDMTCLRADSAPWWSVTKKPKYKDWPTVTSKQDKSTASA